MLSIHVFPGGALRGCGTVSCRVCAANLSQSPILKTPSPEPAAPEPGEILFHAYH